jgi:mRNA interferase RelE/StbE
LGEYRLFETDQFATDLRRLAKAGHARLIEKLHRAVYPQLAHHPHFGPNIKELKGHEPETWRYRIGAWRFFYQIDEEERLVLLIAAAHRGSAY